MAFELSKRPRRHNVVHAIRRVCEGLGMEVVFCHEGKPITLGIE